MVALYSRRLKRHFGILLNFSWTRPQKQLTCILTEHSHLLETEKAIWNKAMNMSCSGVAMSTTEAHEIKTPAQVKSAFSRLKYNKIFKQW